MKQKSIISMAFALIVMMFMTGCDDRPVAPTQLPVAIQSFVQQNFPNQAITYAERDLELFGYKYDVVLADGTQINFDTDDVWDKIESRVSPVPTQLIPAPLTTYLGANFPAVAIVKIDKERYGYEVELANGLELKFNKQGALMEMDD